MSSAKRRLFCPQCRQCLRDTWKLVITHFSPPFLFCLLCFSPVPAARRTQSQDFQTPSVLSHGDFAREKFSERQLRRGRATQPTVHARCFSVFILHRTLTWTTGFFNVRTDILSYDCTRGCTDIVREFASKVDSGTTNPLPPGESNQRQRRVALKLYRLGYLPSPNHWQLDVSIRRLKDPGSILEIFSLSAMYCNRYTCHKPNKTSQVNKQFLTLVMQ